MIVGFFSTESQRVELWANGYAGKLLIMTLFKSIIGVPGSKWKKGGG